MSDKTKKQDKTGHIPASGGAACYAADLPYEVYHPDATDFGLTVTPKFATWAEALSAQVRYNRDCPGHIARKVRRYNRCL